MLLLSVVIPDAAAQRIHSDPMVEDYTELLVLDSWHVRDKDGLLVLGSLLRFLKRSRSQVHREQWIERQQARGPHRCTITLQATNMLH